MSRLASLSFIALVACADAASKLDTADATAPLGATSWDCQTDEQFFSETAWPQVFAVCVACHQQGGQSGNTRLVLVDDTGVEARTKNMQTLRDVALLKHSGAPLILLKATNAVTHGGGERVKKASPEYAILKHWVERSEHPPTCRIEDKTPKIDRAAAPPIEALGKDETLRYLNAIAPMLVERFVGPNELVRVDEKKGAAIPAVLQSFTEDPKLENAARRLIEKLLSASGERDGIDFSLPGNLAAHLVKERQPWTQILTADRCYDDTDRAIDCDSGAPFTAGVLGTRAYLAGRASRFNLTRSSTVMRGFACVSYPIADELQPRIEKSRLIPMFQATNPDEQQDERAKSGFGNGFGCYQCHGQFSLHAQLFVKFDRKGLYRPEATGIQDPKGELGNSTDNLMASHLADPLQAKEERSELFGKPVANLGEAAKVLAGSPVFLPCAARKIIDAVTGTDAATTIDQALLDEIAAAAKARAKNGEPTFQDIVVATFSHPVVVYSVLQGGESR